MAFGEVLLELCESGVSGYVRILGGVDVSALLIEVDWSFVGGVATLILLVVIA